MLFTKMENRSEVDDKREIEVYNNHMLNIRFWFIGQNLQYIQTQYTMYIYTHKQTEKRY